MGRTLLNDLPDWALIVLFTGTVALVGLLALLASRRWLPDGWLALESAEVIMGVCAVVLTLFTVVLAFVLVDLYNGYAGAETNVSNEADSLTQIVADSRTFPLQDQLRIEHAVVVYVHAVVTREFPALRQGGEDPQAASDVLRISAALQQYAPTTTTQIAFYQAAVGQVHQLMSERQQRVDDADTAVPGAFVALLVILAVLGLGTACLIRTHHPPLDGVVVLVVAIVIGAGLVTALILEYPFSGSLAITSSVFSHDSLAALIGSHGIGR